jgi:hypothetical protein
MVSSADSLARLDVAVVVCCGLFQFSTFRSCYDGCIFWGDLREFTCTNGIL